MHVYYIINCTKSYRYPFYDEDKKSCLYYTKKKKNCHIQYVLLEGNFIKQMQVSYSS